MKCLTIKDKFTTIVLEEDINLVQMLQNPIIGDKDKLPLWRFCTQKPDAHGRTNDQLATIHALLIEYDAGEVTIDQFVEKYKEYAFALYTSPSHAPWKHKFRVILPLDQDYQFELWTCREVKCVMKQVFPTIDPTCFTNWQRIPGTANPEHYKYHINKGKKFSYSLIKDKVDEIVLEEKLDREMACAFRLSSSQGNGEVNREAYKAKVDQTTNALVRDLPSHENGSRYSEFCSVMGKLLNCKYPDGEYIYDKHSIKMLLSRVYWDHGLEKALTSFSRRRK